MKTLTIIPEDNMVVLDGNGIYLNVDIDPDIHAVQWNEETKTGCIEDKSNKDNTTIGSKEMDAFMGFATLHSQEKTRLSNVLAEEQAKQIAFDSLPDTKRRVAFSAELTIGDQLDEILKFINSQPVKSVEMQAVIDKSKEIKARFPKEGE